ncbi:MAG: HPr family phosphocarrier protein [Elusimicrobium sp.]|nr:HPr family phosphocarrier protein [Elusimicrobium sp.]
MIKKGLEVKNQMGLHARPAAMLAQTAGKFNSEIKIEKDGVEVNAKSIMGIMMLAAQHGAVLIFTFEGADEAEALKAVEDLFVSGFSEAY